MTADALTYLARLACITFLLAAIFIGVRVAWNALCDWCGIKDEPNEALALVRPKPYPPLRSVKP